jgi:hypothetical protein
MAATSQNLRGFVMRELERAARRIVSSNVVPVLRRII